jgi:hypothetical protein
MTMKRYTSEEIDRIRDMRRSGQSATEIARTVGVSRSAILGLCHRRELDLPARLAKAKQPQDRGTKKPKPRHAEPWHPSTTLIEPEADAVVPEPVKRTNVTKSSRRLPLRIERAPDPTIPEPPAEGISFADLDALFLRCRMPKWGYRDRPAFEEQRYCGRQTLVGRSWCVDCNRRVTASDAEAVA